MTEPYKYLKYEEMRELLQKLSVQHENYMQLKTSEDLYGIKHKVNCSTNELCKLDIVILTDRKAIGPKKQIYISGALHGDEKIGPNSVYYFIEYFLFLQPKNFLQNLEIILTPMTNAVGYNFNEREERRQDFQSFDINRDFPYNQLNYHCLNTIASRVVYKIVTENKI